MKSAYTLTDSEQLEIHIMYGERAGYWLRKDDPYLVEVESDDKDLLKNCLEVSGRYYVKFIEIMGSFYISNGKMTSLFIDRSIIKELKYTKRILKIRFSATSDIIIVE